uniref:Ovule protein n=1 Tax=Bursaphelenchus xylophilus TaxID=6326 RepID=A0A1I7RQZ7_BURXY
MNSNQSHCSTLFSLQVAESMTDLASKPKVRELDSLTHPNIEWDGRCSSLKSLTVCNHINGFYSNLLNMGKIRRRKKWMTF